MISSLPHLTDAVAEEIRRGNTNPDKLREFVEILEQIPPDEAKNLIQVILHDLLNRKWIYFAGSSESYPKWFCRMTSRGYAQIGKMQKKNVL